MDKMKEKWKELGKILGEWENVWAVKQKSEKEKDQNNAQREACVGMDKYCIWNFTTRCMRLGSQKEKVQDKHQ